MQTDKKKALVTGCTKGIGLAITHKLANMGYDIAGCARNHNDLKNLYKQLSVNHLKQNFFLEVCDVSNTNAVKIFAANALKEFGHFDVLVNNAGVFMPGQIHNEEDGVFEYTMNTNVTSVYHLTRAILHGMMIRKDGHIFNLCSTASITAYTNGGSYCISKFALLGMTKVLREELKEHNIKVTAILPGATYTSSWAKSDLPKERFMKPEHVAELVYNAILISDFSNVEEILVRPILGDIT